MVWEERVVKDSRASRAWRREIRNWKEKSLAFKFEGPKKSASLATEDKAHGAEWDSFRKSERSQSAWENSHFSEGVAILNLFLPPLDQSSNLQQG